MSNMSTDRCPPHRRRQSDQATQRPIVIDLRGGTLTLPRRAAKLLERQLTLSSRSASYLPGRGFSATAAAHSLIGYLPGGKAVAPAGLLDRAIAEFRRLGLRVIVRRRKIAVAAMTEPWRRTYSSLEQSGPACHLLDQLVRSPQVYYAAASYSERLMLLLAVLTATAGQNVLIVCRSVAEAVSLARQAAAMGRPVCIGAKYGQRQRGMAYFDVLTNFMSRLRQCWDLIVFFEPSLLRSWPALAALNEFIMPRPARLALGPPLGKLTHDEQLFIEASFGPLIRRRPTASAGVMAVQMRVCSLPGGRCANHLERKRQYIWQHDHRNDYIAGIAIALATGGLRLDEWLGPQASRYASHDRAGRRSVVVLTESDLHAQELRARLPAPANTGTTPAAGIPIVMTWASTESTRLAADAVVMADGLLAAWPRDVALTGVDGRAPLVVDVAAMFDRRAEQAADDRLADYERRGWQSTTLRYESYAAAAGSLAASTTTTRETR